MQPQQIAFPFRIKRPGRPDGPHTDLIGRSYKDGRATMTVTGICLNDSNRVMVERDLDGHAWSMPAWLMRLIFFDKKRKRAA